MRTPRLAAAAALTTTVALALTGCSLLDQDEPKRDEAGQVTEASDAGAFTLRVGDCLETMEWNVEAESFPVAPCAETHESEIYASMLMDDGDFPGADAVNAAADTFCNAEFAAFVGKPWDESSLDYAILTPTLETWQQLDDREILCLVLDPQAGTVTGTLKGAAR